MRLLPQGIAFSLTLLSTLATAAPAWEVQLSERDGLPLASADGQTGVTVSWNFWGAQWKWVDTRAALAGNRQGD